MKNRFGFLKITTILIAGIVLSGCPVTMKPKVKKYTPTEAAERKYLVFEETFDASSDGWFTKKIAFKTAVPNSKDGSSEINDGKMLLTSYVDNMFLVYRKFPVQEIGDWEIRIGIKKVKGSGNQYFGIALGGKKEIENMIPSFKCSSAGICELNKLWRKGWNRKESKTVHKAFHKNKDKNIISLRQRNGTIFGYINGQKVASYRHNSFLNYSKNFGIFLKGKGLQVEIDKIEVYQTKIIDTQLSSSKYYRKKWETEARKLREVYINKSLKCLDKPIQAGYLICDDSLVINTQNNLMWMRYNDLEYAYKKKYKVKANDWKSAYNWKNSQNRAKAFGYDNWRFPTLAELETTQDKKSTCRKKDYWNKSYTKYTQAKAFHCKSSSNSIRFDWALWAQDWIKNEGTQLSFGFGHRKNKSNKAAIRLVRKGPLDLSDIEHYRFWGNSSLTNDINKKLAETKNFLNKGEVTKAEKLFSQIVNKSRWSLYSLGPWRDFLTLPESINRMFSVSYSLGKKQPVFWLDYAMVANQYRHPSLTLQAVKKLDYLLKPGVTETPIPSEILDYYNKAIEILRASAFTQMNREKKGLEIMAKLNINKDNQAIYFLNHSGTDLLIKPDSLSNVTGIPKFRLSESGSNWKIQKPLIDLFSGKTIQPISIYNLLDSKTVNKIKPLGRVLD